MNLFQVIKQALPIAADLPPNTERAGADLPPHPVPLYRRLGGAVFIAVGYLLSPLCWWNDVVFNLPLALGFGYLLSRAYPDALVPLTVVGYWLSNVVGFILMQQGAISALQTEAQSPPSHALRNGLITSTVYTLGIVALLQLHLIDTPEFLKGDLGSELTAMLPNWLPF